MGQTKTHRSVLVFLAIFSRYEQAMAWARKTAEHSWGPIALSSDVFTFDQTDYYERQMGPDLKKQLLVFEQLKDPAQLIQWKHQANEWEGEFREGFESPESRPLNIDPGYLTEAKLVLASTKDRDHRLYLGEGIFAEGTLYFYSGAWCKRPWTYPDYCTPEYHEFLNRCRDYLRHRYRNEPGRFDST